MAARGKAFKWLLALLVLAGIGAGGWWLWKNRFSIKGIDVSRYQGTIDWKKVKADGIRFAFIKATEGTTLVDPYFSVNWEGAEAHGVVRGAYHFFRPGLDGTVQAEHFLQRIQWAKGDLPPVLDLEVTDGVGAEVIRREALEWLTLVEKRTGRKPIVYTLPHYAKSYLNGKFGRFPLWVVDLNPFFPRGHDNWKTWTFWQHSHHGSVDGIEGEVDLNVFGGTEAEFLRLMK
jgi:lysozyme